MNTKIIAEIGINHNGSIDLVKELIDVAAIAHCTHVKFQKRNPYKCVPENQKQKIKNTPWGKMTYLEYKTKIEFNEQQYIDIFKYADNRQIVPFASVWDVDSAKFMTSLTDIVKIPSALINNQELLQYCKNNFNFRIMSTGMSNQDTINEAIKILDPNVIMHTNSTYPCSPEELRLDYIKYLQDNTSCEIGYSGHEFGLITTFASVVLGATWIERHITIDRTIWGSDQWASVEPHGLIKLVKGIKDIEKSIVGGYGPRTIYPTEIEKLETLRK